MILEESTNSEGDKSYHFPVLHFSGGDRVHLRPFQSGEDEKKLAESIRDFLQIKLTIVER